MNQRVVNDRLVQVDGALEANDMRLAALEEKLAKVMRDVQSSLDAQYHAIGEFDSDCNELLHEVDDLRADVADGKEEVDTILSEVKRLAVDTEAAIKAQLENVQRAKEADEAALISITKASRKRAIEEAYEDEDMRPAGNESSGNDENGCGQQEQERRIIIANSRTHSARTNNADVEMDSEPLAAPGIIQPAPLPHSLLDNRPSPAKRARIEIVIPSAAGVLAGAVAGSLLTWAGLAFA